MRAKIIIKRRFKDGHSAAISELLKKIRSDALRQSGYMSGETLIGWDNQNEIVVISTWKSMDAWKAWLNTPSRQEDENLLEELMEEPPKYEYYLTGESQSAA